MGAWEGLCCGHYFAAALQIDRDHSGLIEREEFEDALREMKKSEVRFHSVACLPPGMQPQDATDNTQRAAM
jgi:hypothetical protein